MGLSKESEFIFDSKKPISLENLKKLLSFLVSLYDFFSVLIFSFLAFMWILLFEVSFKNTATPLFGLLVLVIYFRILFRDRNLHFIELYDGSNYTQLIKLFVPIVIFSSPSLYLMNKTILPSETIKIGQSFVIFSECLLLTCIFQSILIQKLWLGYAEDFCEGIESRLRQITKNNNISIRKEEGFFERILLLRETFWLPISNDRFFLQNKKIEPLILTQYIRAIFICEYCMKQINRGDFPVQYYHPNPTRLNNDGELLFHEFLDNYKIFNTYLGEYLINHFKIKEIHKDKLHKFEAFKNKIETYCLKKAVNYG